MKPPTRAQYSVVGRVGPIGLADKKSLGCPTRRLSRHPTGDQDSRHRMDEPHLRAASIGAHREMVSSEPLRKPEKARMNVASDGRSILMASDGQTSLNVGWKR